MINQYKRLDVFRCSQEAHTRFGGRVSVFHVLKEKQCYPQGCIYFLWHCVLLEKGNHCVSGYQYTGKDCKGCTYFAEEKIHLQPELVLDEAEFACFQDELYDFETWLEDVRFKWLNIAGRIKHVKPWFERRILPTEKHTRLCGYIIVFKSGFIGNKAFNDTFYVRVSERLMKVYQFIPKMKVEMNGEIREDRGRIVVHRPKRIEIIKPGWGKPMTRDRALVAMITSTLLREQPDQCLACQWGALIDVSDRTEPEERRYRNLCCLKGIADSDACYIGSMAKIKSRK